MNKAYLEIDLNKLESNAKEITSKYRQYKYFIGVLKSQAYGHGEYVVNSLIKGGINYIAVSYIEEALKVREYNKDIPILCLQPIFIDDINIAVKNHITITVDSLDYLKDVISKAKGKINIHLKIDTGMNRLGFKNKEEIKEASELIESCEYTNLEGIYTHMAYVGLFDNGYDRQIERLKDLTSLIDLNKIEIIHIASSVIMISHDKLPFVNGVRPGIALYGYNVSLRESDRGIKNKLRILRNRYYQKKYNLSHVNTNVLLNLKPAMKMFTYVMATKNVKNGESIGYGGEYKADRDMKIAILPVGYYNGIGKRNAVRYVLINGKRCFAVGRMSMNMLIVEIDDSIKRDDKVTLLGDGITPRVFANFNQTDVVDILLELGKSNARYYLKNNKIIYREGINRDENDKMDTK